MIYQQALWVEMILYIKKISFNLWRQYISKHQLEQSCRTTIRLVLEGYSLYANDTPLELGVCKQEFADNNRGLLPHLHLKGALRNGFEAHKIHKAFESLYSIFLCLLIVQASWFLYPKILVLVFSNYRHIISEISSYGHGHRSH